MPRSRHVTLFARGRKVESSHWHSILSTRITEMTSNKSPTRPSKSDLEAMKSEAAELVNLLLDCIPRKEKQKRKTQMKFWDWAQKALKTGADKGTTFDRMVTEAKRQLPIPGAIPKGGSGATNHDSKLSSMREKYTASGHYRYFRNLCRNNAEMIIVRARVKRAKRNPTRVDSDTDPDELPTLHSKDDQ